MVKPCNSVSLINSLLLQTRLCDISVSDHMLHMRLERRDTSEPAVGRASHHHHSYSNTHNNASSLDALEATLTGQHVSLCTSRTSIYNIITHTSQPAPDPPITVDSSPSSSTYGDACDQLSQTEEDEDMEEDGGLDSLMFEPDTADEVYQKAMQQPLSEQLHAQCNELCSR